MSREYPKIQNILIGKKLLLGETCVLFAISTGYIYEDWIALWSTIWLEKRSIWFRKRLVECDRFQASKNGICTNHNGSNPSRKCKSANGKWRSQKGGVRDRLEAAHSERQPKECRTGISQIKKPKIDYFTDYITKLESSSFLNYRR